MKQRDVVIIGGGPVGLYLACLLGERCILFEKGTFPRWKSCGSIITPWVQHRLLKMGFPETSFTASYPEFDLYFEEKRKVTLSYGYPLVRSVPRLDLSWFLYQQALSAGAVIREQSVISRRNLDISACVIKIKGEQYSYADLVWADGAATQSGHEQTPLHTFQYELARCKFNRLATGWSAEYGPNYTWAHAIGSGNVLVGIGGQNPRSLPQSLRLWMDRIEVEVPTEGPFHWIVPHWPRSLNPEPHIYRIGDAAGVASAFTGEGYHNALLSADWVARMILAGIDGPEIAAIHRQQRMHYWLWNHRCRSARFNRASNTAIKVLTQSHQGRAFLAWFYGMGNIEYKEAAMPG